MGAELLLIQVRAKNDPMLLHEQQALARRLGPGLRIDARNAVVEPASEQWLAGKQGLIIGGSGDFSVHKPDNKSWVESLYPLVETALSRSIPSLGICFGHQVLGQFLGQPVSTSAEHSELGTITLHQKDAARDCPLLADLPSTFVAQSGHTDWVQGVPAGVELIVTNETCETQGFWVRGKPFYSFQFHPDMTGAEARDRYLAYREGFSERINETHQTDAERFKVGSDEALAIWPPFVKLMKTYEPS